MGLLRRRGGNISIRVYTVPEPQGPQAAPDLLAESWQRDIDGRSAGRALGPERAPNDTWERETRHWPDAPLDPVVFPPPGEAP